MLYSISFDLFADDDRIYSEDEIKEFLREHLASPTLGVRHVKLIEVKDD